MRTKAIKILNPDLAEDYHIHSSNYSDGFNTVEEIIKQAKKLGLKKIAITDHAHKGRIPLEPRKLILNFKNIYTDVDVTFGIEADILNEKGDITTSLGGVPSDFILVSFHPLHYQDDPSTLTQAYINVIKRHHDKIFCLCHLHMGNVPWGDVPEFDVKKVIETANEYGVPIEINGSYLEKKGRKKVLDLIWELADVVVLNTDSHSIENMKDRREKLKQFLKERGYFQ
jgi:histidinol phosphatase-like PHP family hydrolase